MKLMNLVPEAREGLGSKGSLRPKIMAVGPGSHGGGRETPANNGSCCINKRRECTLKGRLTELYRSKMNKSWTGVEVLERSKTKMMGYEALRHTRFCQV